MSVCRWSTDDRQCDLYVWADVTGYWAIAVAARRTVYEAPLPEPVPMTPDTVDAFIARERAVAAIPQHAEEIGLPHAGEVFCEPTGAEAADRVAYLRGLGYRCPDDVERVLRDEEP